MDGAPRAMTCTGFLAAEGYEEQLRQELGENRIVATHGRLLLVEGEAAPAAWAANSWHDPRRSR